MKGFLLCGFDNPSGSAFTKHKKWQDQDIKVVSNTFKPRHVSSVQADTARPPAGWVLLAACLREPGPPPLLRELSLGFKLLAAFTVGALCFGNVGHLLLPAAAGVALKARENHLDCHVLAVCHRTRCEQLRWPCMLPAVIFDCLGRLQVACQSHQARSTPCPCHGPRLANPSTA